MGQERTGYKRDAILIEASRILSPQFDSLGIYLTGAEVELLRNAVHILDKPTTFVDEYHSGYYVTPTDNDWDTILSIVANLQRKLMGNDNTIFAYNDRLFAWHANADHSPGQQLLETMPVPAGYVHVAEYVSMMQATTTDSFQLVMARNNGLAIRLKRWDNISAGIASVLPIHIPLKEGDSIRALWGNTVNDEYIELAVWGYIMKVPE